MLALVYRGPAALPACSAAVAELLRDSRWDLQVAYVGPREDLALDAATLATAGLYAQPGGGTLRAAYRRLRWRAADVRGFVASGGHYLGFCLGGYLAGATPGFDLLPGDTDRYIGSPGAAVNHDGDTVVPVRWRGQDRFSYFQDGPQFLLDHSAQGVDVLATYTNGAVAALVAPYGAGRVGVVGPHPEATADWYSDSDRPNPDGVRTDLGQDLVDTLLAPR